MGGVFDFFMMRMVMMMMIINLWYGSPTKAGTIRDPVNRI